MPKIKLPEPKIEIEAGKIWEGDVLKREQYAQNIRAMLADETEPLVVAVNGKWGCGKSFFLARFAKEYEMGEHGGNVLIAHGVGRRVEDGLENLVMLAHAEMMAQGAIYSKARPAPT